MVRQGALASFIVILAACSPEVDDPANFTAGNTNGNSAGTTAGGTAGTGEGTTDVADGSASATSTTGNVDGPADTTAGAVDSSGGGPVDTGNVGNCGNGVIDAGEQCDGGDLQGFDCASLGLNGGTLACDPMMCTFDTSMCSSTTGGTSG
jgi:hypothetical protein